MYNENILSYMYKTTYTIYLVYFKFLKLTIVYGNIDVGIKV